MAFNRKLLRLLLMVLFLVVFPQLSSLWAQSDVQRLTWIGDEYALRYEIIIEKEDDDGEYRGVQQEFTDAYFIEVSLSPGKYRFRVIPYDYLDQPGKGTEWMNFEVLSGVSDEEDKEESGTKKHEGQPAYIFLGAAWMPLFPLYGENQFFGLSARFYAVSAGQHFLRPGIELTASWRTYENGAGQAVHLAGFDFNILAQKYFLGGRTALNLCVGTGFSLSPDEQYSMHINIGLSFLWLFVKNFYLESGIEYSQFFVENNFFFSRPWIGLGYRF